MKIASIMNKRLCRKDILVTASQGPARGAHILEIRDVLNVFNRKASQKWKTAIFSVLESAVRSIINKLQMDSLNGNFQQVYITSATRA